MMRIPFLAGIYSVLMASWALAASNPEVRIATAPSCGGQGTIASTVSQLTMPAQAAGSAMTFQAGFDAITWAGHLQKMDLPTADKSRIGTGSMQAWDAGIVLTGVKGAVGQQGIPPNPLPDARHIYIGRPNADKSFSTVEFMWNRLSDVQKNALNTSPATKKQDGLGAKRVAYLRGDRVLELDKPSGIFRPRTSVLGDIVNSRPVYSGEPSLRVQGDGYRDFYDQNRKRAKAVYVGVNDGMLHAFDADDGRELFAYVPNALIPDLALLTSPDYQHRPYVDGGIDVAEAQVGGKWKTVLASGMGGGAQGVFALDVTQPSAFGNGMGAIFEFTDADDPDMGNLMGAPVIAKFRTRFKGGASEYKYFVVVPAGLNNYRNDGKGLFNKDGAAALFLLSLDKPPSEPWKLGSNYYKFRTPSKEPALPNGLATPALVLGAEGAVRYAYAGDLQGNLWRFDFTGDLPWKGALPTDTPLFVAKDDKGEKQPIVMQPKVVFAPGGYVVLFGTGKYFEEADTVPGGFRAQSFYGIYDTTDAKYKVAGRAELAVRHLSVADKEVIGISGAAFEYGSGEQEKKGWYVDFPDSGKSGERAVSDAQLADGILYFSTLIPGSGFCMKAGGRSYVLNPLTGLAAGNGSSGHVAMSWTAKLPMLIQTSARVGDRNPIGRRAIRKTYELLEPITDGGQAGDMKSGSRGSTVEVVLPAGRLSWREIVNWQELKNAIGKK